MFVPVIVSLDSLLVRMAVELRERHAPSRDGLTGETWCLRCWARWPCPPALHAREVCEAAGLALQAVGPFPGADHPDHAPWHAPRPFPAHAS
jgi:hypothetical protein